MSVRHELFSSDNLLVRLMMIFWLFWVRDHGTTTLFRILCILDFILSLFQNLCGLFLAYSRFQVEYSWLMPVLMQIILGLFQNLRGIVLAYSRIYVDFWHKLVVIQEVKWLLFVDFSVNAKNFLMSYNMKIFHVRQMSWSSIWRIPAQN